MELPLQGNGAACCAGDRASRDSDAAGPSSALAASTQPCSSKKLPLTHPRTHAHARSPQCHNGQYYPSPPYKPNQEPFCPFNFYRTSVDVEVLYASIFGINLPRTLPVLRANLSFPSCYAYPDMLEIGVTPGLHKGEVALTPAEARAHFGAWAIVSSPLVLGLDVRDDKAMDAVWPVISNREAIAINAAWAGHPGGVAAEAAHNASWAFCGSQYPAGCSAPAWQALYKPLPSGAAALLLLNHDNAGAAVNITVPLSAIPGLACAAQGCKVRDVWQHADIAGVVQGALVMEGAAHDSVFVKLA